MSVRNRKHENNGIKRPKTTGTSLYFDKQCGRYKIKWMDIATGKSKTKTVPLGVDPVLEAERIRNELDLELMDGGYDTIESRIREFISTKERLVRERNNGTAIKNINKMAEDIACVSFRTVSKGGRVIQAIDDMYEDGDFDSANLLRGALNRNVNTAYSMIDDKYKNVKTKSNIDALISQVSGNLARKLDDRYRVNGGQEYRNECMALLKKLDAKISEWRASE